MTLRNLSTGSLKAQVTLNHGTDSSVSWESDAPEVASVDQDGRITAYRSGTAEITVTTRAGEIQTAFSGLLFFDKKFVLRYAVLLNLL